VVAALRSVKTRVKPRFLRWTIGVAAAAAVALMSVLLNPSRVREGDTTAVAVMLATETGARDTALLADGTRIILGPSSQVIVKGRVVELSGEAFFTIAHDETRPYTVRAGGIVIRDIGTEFGVQSYPGERMRVVVTSGAVELETRSSKVMLDSGDVGVVAPGGAVARTADAVTADDLAWTQGRLVFRDASVAQLAADLRRWYGVELRVTDSALARKHFTGEFRVGEPVGLVTDAVAIAFGARAQRRGDTIIVSPAARR
jgi:transmembrane sensor